MNIFSCCWINGINAALEGALLFAFNILWHLKIVLPVLSELQWFVSSESTGILLSVWNAVQKGNIDYPNTSFVTEKLKSSFFFINLEKL